MKNNKNILFITIILKTSIMKTFAHLKYMFFSEWSFDEDVRKYKEKWPWEEKQGIILLTHSEIYREILFNGQRTALVDRELCYENILKQADLQIPGWYSE